MDTWTEYGVFAADGPHKGLCMRMFKKRKSIDTWLKITPGVGAIYIKKRTVTATDWEQE